ncbi:MAG: SMI1/KNR4 family protein [Pirellulaceae bacterium]
MNRSARTAFLAQQSPPLALGYRGRSSAKDSMLRTLFPNGRFAPPATEAAILEAETLLGVELPSQLRELYLTCDGFREDKGNAKYLFSLTNEEYIGSLVSITKHMWSEWSIPDLRPFLFFGSSSCDDYWGINFRQPDKIIAFNHHMEDHYEIVGTDIVQVFREDYERYDGLV